MRGVRGRVQRGLRGRVVQRGVAEAADGDRVVRPRALDAELAGAVDRDRHSDRSRQVRGDRRRLRDHGQVVVAEHLVAAAGDRLVDRGRDAEHHVGNAVAAHLPGAGEVERARAVVEQRRVGGAERERDDGVALVPGRADRVEAAALLLQPARGEVAVTARDLGLPERLGAAVPWTAGSGRRLERRERCEEMLLERIEVVGRHRHGASRAQPKKANGRTTSESIASSQTTAPPVSTSPCSRAARASASSRVSVPTIRCFQWRIGR